MKPQQLPPMEPRPELGSTDVVPNGAAAVAHQQQWVVASLRLEVHAAEEALLRRETTEAERVARLEDELDAARRLGDEQGRELEAERSKARS